jgi:hypothetical protein
MSENERKILPFVRKGEKSGEGNIDNDPRVQALLDMLQNLKESLSDKENAPWEKQDPEAMRTMMNDIDALEEKLHALRKLLLESLNKPSE